MALKTLSVNFEDDPTFIDLFMREEWVGKRLHSPHIAKVITSKRRKNFLYYLCEYIEGQTLAQWMKDNPSPSLIEVRGIIGQITLGLRAFHRKEMVHQDLKPDNIIIDKHGTLKIIDFGSTRIAGLEEVKTPIEQLDLLGTVDYSAPEYHLGMKGNAQSDLYSLGVIAYEMLTGKLPYGKGFTSSASIHKVDYMPANALNNIIPAWVDAALEKSVHKDRNKRYQAFTEFLKDLETPNSNFLNKEWEPLLQRDPKQFWQGVAIASILGNLALLAFVLN